MARSRRRDKEAERRDAAELEELRPYLGLAREIHHEVDRVAADSGAPVESLVEAIARIPDRQRVEMAHAVFEQLPPEQQWAVVAEAFDDDEVRAALRHEHDALRRRLQLDESFRERAASARADGRLDTTALAGEDVLTIGLFTARDVQAIVGRGRVSDAAARVLTLRVEPVGDRDLPAGTLRVLTDSFNPGGGYFVTTAYDQETWEGERLESHALVRVGAAPSGGTGPLEPVLFPGARVDIQRVGIDDPALGRLHLGWAALGPVDVFAD